MVTIKRIKMQENDKIGKKLVKIQFLIRKRLRDPRTNRVITLYACFDKDVG